MLEQLYYSWPLTSGSQFEAASSGLVNAQSERFRAIQPFLNYKLPQGTDTSAADLDKTPLSLLFADTGKERIIAQKVYKGRDKYSRETHFVHLLAGLPADFVAYDAIELWRSPFWATAAVKDSFSLSQVQPDELKHQPGTLSERDIASFEQYLPRLIQAYLTLSETHKIYIAAPNAQVAVLLWGLTHSIPRTLQQSLTFSTYEYFSAYEHNVTRDPVRIVCTSEPSTELLKGYNKPADLLPAECYFRNSVAINCYSGKTSDLKYVSQEIIDYSLYATTCFVQGKKKELDTLLTQAEQQATQNVEEFLAVCELHSPFAQSRTLTLQEVTRLLNNEKLAADILYQEQVRRAIIDFAITSPQWWNGQAVPALMRLHPPLEHAADTQSIRAREALTAFGVQVMQTLYDSMLQNKTQTSQVLMQMLYTITPPNKDVKLWLQLLQSFSAYMMHDKQFHPAKAFAWEFRTWLLQQWAYGYQHISDELILPWLQFTWNDILHLLTLPNIPEKWHQLALIELLSHSKEPLPKQIVSLFNNSRYQTLCIGALRELMRFASTQPVALHCFQKLVEYGYGNKTPLLIALLEVRIASKNDILTPEMLNDFLTATRMKDREKIELLQEQSLLLLGAGHRELAPALVDIILVYIDKLTVEKLLDKSAQSTLETLDLLGKLVDKLPNNLAERIKAWVYIGYGIARKSFVLLPFDKKFLTAMGKSIVTFKLQHHQAYRDSLFQVLSISIHTVDELKLVLEAFAVPLEKRTPKELLYDLSTFTGEQYNPYLPHEILLPYIAVSLEYASMMQSKLDKAAFLVPLLKALLKNVNDDIFTELQKIALTWPKAYQKDWQQYAAPQGKRSLQQILGDVVGSNLAASVIEGAKIIGGGNPRPPHSPSAQTPMSPQQNQPPIKEQAQTNSPFVPSPANAPLPQPEPQSTVNGQPIFPQWIVTVFKLKGPYIEYRANELKKELIEHQKKRLGIEWIHDEQDMLRNFVSPTDTLKLLEVDVLLNDALGHFKSIFSDPQLDPKPLLEKVYKDLQGKYKGYPEEEIKNVLLVFIRYRILAEYFRKQNPPVRLRHWLDKQWLAANDQGRIVRSPNPLPDGK